MNTITEWEWFSAMAKQKIKKNHNGIAIRQAVDSNEGDSQEVGKAGGQNEEKLSRMIKYRTEWCT